MASLNELIASLQEIVARIGPVKHWVAIQDGLLVVRYEEGSKTVCCIGVAEGGEAIEIDWKGCWSGQGGPPAPRRQGGSGRRMPERGASTAAQKRLDLEGRN